MIYLLESPDSNPGGVLVNGFEIWICTVVQCFVFRNNDHLLSSIRQMVVARTLFPPCTDKVLPNYTTSLGAALVWVWSASLKPALMSSFAERETRETKKVDC